MPLNEAESFHHGNLTEKEQQEAMSAIYGLEKPMTPTPAEILTYEERVKMRRYLDDLDRKEASGVKEFDLNKPPIVPYVYREFPFLMYHHETKRTKAAPNHEIRERMIAEGWSTDPFPAEGTEIPLTAAEHAEVEKLNEELKKKKR